MKKNSVENLVEWLKVKPRTYGWSAVMAYSRTETNEQLLQEFINRFGTGHYQDPITDEIKDNTTPTQKEYVHNYQLDAPRIAFWNSNLQTSEAELSMKVVAGSHLTFSKPQGNSRWSLVQISQEDALNGPRLDMNINLLKSSGSVTSAGGVYLDIAEGTDYKLSYVQTEHLQKVAGKRFQEIFKRLPDAKKKFMLNELVFKPGQFLTPESFEIRTHNKEGSGARLLAGEGKDEGAVLAFVKMKGDTGEVSLPVNNRDLKYLLPKGYSATVLMGHHYFFEKFFFDGLSRITNHHIIQIEKVWSPDGQRIVKLIGTGGARWERVDEKFSLGEYTYEVEWVRADFFRTSPSDSFEMHLLNNNTFSLTWKKKDFKQGFFHRKGGASAWHTDILSTWSVKFDFSYEIGASGELTITSKEAYSQISFGDPETSLIPVGHYQYIKQKFNFLMTRFFSRAMIDLVSATDKINIWTLTSLLFRDKNAVTFDAVHHPADLALLGHIRPTSNSFTITQLEPVLGHTQTFQFTTVPPRNDLTWDVHNILGEAVPKGSINARGLYTAPKASEIEGEFVRVRVAATAGGYTQSALVTVMRKNITVNPIIRYATAGDLWALDFSAGTVSGDVLTWSIKEPSSGAVIKPNPDEGKDHSYVPGPPQTGVGYTVDEIVVKNTRTNEVQSAHVLVLHRVPFFTVVIDDRASLPDNKVQLVVMGQNGPVDPGRFDLTWQVLLGNGSASIDSRSGVLTVDPAGPDKYVVVITTLPSIAPGDFPDSQGSILLPLSLFSISQTYKMLCTDDQ